MKTINYEPAISVELPPQHVADKGFLFPFGRRATETKLSERNS